MKFEHKKEKIASKKVFIFRVFRYSIICLLIILISILIGCFGYHYLAELNWLDSFHMSCLILTGMGPIAEMKTESAKIFSSLYALYSGVAFLGVTAVFMAPIAHRILHLLNLETEE